MNLRILTSMPSGGQLVVNSKHIIDRAVLTT